MVYNLDGTDYEVIIVKKNNKNTYIRVKEDFRIYVTTNYYVTKRQIKKLLDENHKYLKKAFSTQKKKQLKQDTFFYLGQSYDIIEVSTMKDIEIDNSNHIIYMNNLKSLNRWLKKEICKVFKERYLICFEKFQECKKIPQLKIRLMKSRWGVYNRKNHSITLNSHLIEYKISDLDYVIFHELSHTVYFDHSKKFWELVSKYCPDYRTCKKDLKE